MQHEARFKFVHGQQLPGVGIRHGRFNAVFDALQRRGVIVRPLKLYSLPEWVRVTVGTAAQNERVLAELAAVRR